MRITPNSFYSQRNGTHKDVRISGIIILNKLLRNNALSRLSGVHVENFDFDTQILYCNVPYMRPQD